MKKQINIKRRYIVILFIVLLLFLYNLWTSQITYSVHKNILHTFDTCIELRQDGSPTDSLAIFHYYLNPENKIYYFVGEHLPNTQRPFEFTLSYFMDKLNNSAYVIKKKTLSDSLLNNVLEGMHLCNKEDVKKHLKEHTLEFEVIDRSTKGITKYGYICIDDMAYLNINLQLA